jgi:hypothetical protein
VGNAFVHQYYNVLHQSPELVYRFYQDASRLGRPANTSADMDVVTTMEVKSLPVSLPTSFLLARPCPPPAAAAAAAAQIWASVGPI